MEFGHRGSLDARSWPKPVARARSRLKFDEIEVNPMRSVIAFVLIAALFNCSGCISDSDADLSKNKEVVNRFIELSNDAKWEQLADVVMADFRRHSAATAGEPVRSLAEFIALQKNFMSTFPDQHVRLDHMIAEGDYVAIRATYTGTQTGAMGEFPATGKSVDGPFIAFFRIESGKIAELWVEWDNVVLLNQLGMFPPPSPPND
jgi:steroid delta-isomerase-like uncharacterized protein